jgi:hypothetical protein
MDKPKLIYKRTYPQKMMEQTKSEPSKKDKSLYRKVDVRRIKGVIDRYKKLLAAIGRL